MKISRRHTEINSQSPTSVARQPLCWKLVKFILQSALILAGGYFASLNATMACAGDLGNNCLVLLVTDDWRVLNSASNMPALSPPPANYILYILYMNMCTYILMYSYRDL